MAGAISLTQHILQGQRRHPGATGEFSGIMARRWDQGCHSTTHVQGSVRLAPSLPSAG